VHRVADIFRELHNSKPLGDVLHYATTITSFSRSHDHMTQYR